MRVCDVLYGVAVKGDSRGHHFTEHLSIMMGGSPELENSNSAELKSAESQQAGYLLPGRG